MTRIYKFSGSKAIVEERDGGFVANCRCGWNSGVEPTRESAIIEFEKHVQSDPKHKIREEEKGGISYSSLFLSILCFIYVVYPTDILPDSLIFIGWIGDFLLLLLGIVFIIRGLRGNGPLEIISDIFN